MASFGRALEQAAAGKALTWPDGDPRVTGALPLPTAVNGTLMGQPDLRAVAPSTCQRVARGHRDH
jgi:hypothetical protein